MQITQILPQSEPVLPPTQRAAEVKAYDKSKDFDDALASEKERRELDAQAKRQAAKVAGKDSSDESSAPEHFIADDEVLEVDDESLTANQTYSGQADEDQSNEDQDDWHDFLASVMAITQDSSKKSSDEPDMAATVLPENPENPEIILKPEMAASNEEITEDAESDTPIREAASDTPVSTDGADAALLLDSLIEQLLRENPELDEQKLRVAVDQLSEQLGSALAALKAGDLTTFEQQLNALSLPEGLTDAVSTWLQAVLTLDQEQENWGDAEQRLILQELASLLIWLGQDESALKEELKADPKIASDASPAQSLQGTLDRLLSRIDDAGNERQVRQNERVDASGPRPDMSAAPRPNQVLAAFIAAAREMRAAETQNSEATSKGGDTPLVQRFEGALSAMVTDARPANVVPQVATVNSTANPTTAQAANLNPGAPLPTQGTNETPFEQARQIQQHIELFGPQAPAQLRDQVAVMYNSRHQFAEMRLDPPELGRLQIRLQMTGEQAIVTFQVSSPQAREAVEQALPRLKEMLEEQGIQLADANVREESQQLQQQFAEQGSSSGGKGEAGEKSADTEADDVESVNVRVPLGRIDYYA
ncbi:MAG: flagellar hook-length control protein FliK [Idiomarina sp.]|nr:flagellar hook-length control protein FliK [Idiomarina sp.]